MGDLSIVFFGATGCPADIQMNSLMFTGFGYPLTQAYDI